MREEGCRKGWPKGVREERGGPQGSRRDTDSNLTSAKSIFKRPWQVRRSRGPSWNRGTRKGVTWNAKAWLRKSKREGTHFGKRSQGEKRSVHRKRRMKKRAGGGKTRATVSLLGICKRRSLIKRERDRSSPLRAAKREGGESRKRRPEKD